MNNSKKKAFFNVRLYLEGIRQLKIVGVMGAIIMAGAAFLIPLADNISNSNKESYINGKWVYIGGVVRTYSVFQLNPFIIASFLILTPLMVMALFDFLNKRNACDFYHAVPDTRTCLFVSYGSAVLTWNAAILLLSYVITAISGAVFPFVTVDYSQAFVIFINCMAGCFFMLGVFVIAMSLTGTIFTNLAVGVMILVVPRTIVTVFVYLLTDAVWILPFSFGDSILDDRLNVVTNMVTGVLIRGEVSGLFMWKSTLYTLIVGAVYCVIALKLFKERKSEAAATAAINVKLQCAIRLIPAILISLIPLAVLINNRTSNYEMDSIEYFDIVVLYLIAVLSYFLYELITTKKLKNLLRAIPGLLWLVVFNAAFYGLFLISCYTILNNVPQAANVKYVNIDFGSQYYYGQFDLSSDDSYYVQEVKKISIDSEEVKELLVSELERNVDCVKENESVWNYIEYPASSYISNTTRVVVEFHTNFGSKTRFVYLSPQKMDRLMELLQADSQIEDVIYEPVASEKIKYYNGNDMSDEEIYEIYLAYVEDIKNSNKKEAYYNILTRSSDHEYVLAYLRLTLNNNESIIISVGDDTPKALQTYLKKYNKPETGKTENLLKELLDSDFWEKDTKYQYYDLSCEMSVFPKNSKYYDWFRMEGEAESYLEDGEIISNSRGRYNFTDEEVRRAVVVIANRIEGSDYITDTSSGNILSVHYQESYCMEGQTETTEVDKHRYYMIDDETMELLRDLY